MPRRPKQVVCVVLAASPGQGDRGHLRQTAPRSAAHQPLLRPRVSHLSSTQTASEIRRAETRAP